MALIYLTTTAEESSWNPYALANFNRVLKSSKHSVECRHLITSSPNEADIILFIGSKCIYHSDIINSDIYLKPIGTVYHTPIARIIYKRPQLLTPIPYL